MRVAAFLILVTALALGAVAQTSPPANSTAAPTADLDKLQSAASQANSDISHIRIEKWKADSSTKQQSQANADSIQRNLTQALPSLIANFRAAPQDLNAGFKLYRNLNALYDVMASFTESAGAFGPRSDYEELAQQLNVIDSVRHDLGNDIEGLTASTQSELSQLRAQVHVMQQAAAAPPSPPKKVVVDDTEPAKKTTHKKKSTANSSNSGSKSATDNQATTPAPAAKSQ